MRIFDLIEARNSGIVKMKRKYSLSLQGGRGGKMKGRILVAAFCMVCGLCFSGCNHWTTEATNHEKNLKTIEMVQSGEKKQGIVSCYFDKTHDGELDSLIDAVHEHHLRIASISHYDARMDFLIERE